MNSHLIKKIIFMFISILEILGIIACLIIYSSIFTFIPWHSSLSIKMIIPVIALFIFTGISFYFMSHYVVIQKKRKLISIVEIVVIFVSAMLIKVFSYPYSLVMAISIANLAFNIIILCEVIIFLVNKYKKLKFYTRIK